MRWWIYQKERFPVFKNGLLVLAFSASAVTYSSLVTQTGFTRLAIIIAFINSLIFFLQLRIADEFKDAEEDATYRPYRPVPRGLVTLQELRSVFIIGGIIQVVLSLLISPYLIITLLLSWLYLALMSKEFFVREWITARPITYLWTHMLMMPLVDFYATSCHWITVTEKPWAQLLFFLCASFFNGLVIELGRKLRLPQNEENGVPTYSKLWGLRKAVWIWFGCLIATFVFALLAAVQIGALTITLGVLLFLLLVSALLCFNSNWHKESNFENFSGIWTLALYLNLGIIPLLTQ